MTRRSLLLVAALLVGCGRLQRAIHEMLLRSPP